MNISETYLQFIKDLKQNIVQSRYIAARLANKEQLLLYLQTGKMLSDKINTEKWGNAVLKTISSDLQQALPGLRGFSDRNLYNMKLFYEAYPHLSFSQSTTAKMDSSVGKTKEDIAAPAFFGISFTHHILLLHKCKAVEERTFYMALAATQFWSVSLLEHHIKSQLYHKQGKLPNNFEKTLPATIKSTALQVFKDEYLFDFISLEESEDERVIEESIVSNIKQAIMKLGKGFSFIGNQYRLEIGEQEFFIDLLFYNRYLQCLVAFELKRGKFKPEYAGQLNFYLNVLDDQVKLPHEQPSIGIILCKEKNNMVVEYSIKTINKAMGVATYKTTHEVPKEMKGILPNPDELTQLLNS
jgi:predicted nuclease of restriction endonuclease-like (RecB) superfamily